MPTLPEQFFATARRGPQKCVLRYKQGGTYRDLTFAQVEAAVRQVGSALIKLGLRPGDRFAILCENRPEWVMADLGSMLAGAVTVPIHTTFSARLAAEVLKNSGSRFLLVSGSEQLRKILSVIAELSDLEKIVFLEAEPSSDLDLNRFLRWSDFLALADEATRFPATSPHDLCTLLYTSGTTGRSKGVMLTHHNFLSNAHAALQAIPFNDQDILLSILPLSHVLERCGGYYAPLVIAGARIAYAKSLKEIPENLREIQPTALILVPRLFEQIYDRIQQEFSRRGGIARRIFRWSLGRTPGTPAYYLADKLIFRKIRARFGGRLRFAISGGAALNPRNAIFFRQVGIIIAEGYGLTETSPVISVNRPHRIKIGTVGPPLEGIQVKIAADGEVLVKGEGNTRGYWQDDKSTQELIDLEGWLHTGDLGAMDEEGFLKIIGRKKEMLVTASGKNVYPEALESKLNASPYIAQSMIVGDGEKYLAVLIVPDKANLAAFAQQSGISENRFDALQDHPRIKTLYRQEIDLALTDVAQHEKIAKFRLIPQEFSLEREEMTPSLKIRRHIIIQHYNGEIQGLFRSKSSA